MELEADTGSSLTELRNVSFSCIYNCPPGGLNAGVGDAQRKMRANGVQQVSLLPSISCNGVHNHSRLINQNNAEQSQSTPSSAGICPSIPTNPFPVLLCSADGLFVQMLGSQALNSSRFYSLSWVADNTGGELNDHLLSQLTSHVQLSKQVLAPSVSQGLFEGLSHRIASVPVQPATYQPDSNISKNAQTMPRTKEGKSFIECALPHVSVQLCAGEKYHGTYIKFCPAGSQSKSENVKNTSTAGKFSTQHQSSKSKTSSKVLVDHVNIIGPSRLSDFVEKMRECNPGKEKPKKTAANEISISGKIKKRKTRRKVSKMSCKPSNYYPHWPTLELDEEEDLSSMAAFFKSIRSRRREKRRFTSRELVIERTKEVVEKLCAGCEEGLKVMKVEGKGRGVVAMRLFEKDEFVVEYAGELINITTANQREELYERDERVGCYMYYFSHREKQYCIDATEESGKLGRLLNHSRHGNCYTKVVEVGSMPRLVLLAAHRIEQGQELTYDYGDRSAFAVENHPWLKN